jgi:sugar lactone lactonase YvrE
VTRRPLFAVLALLSAVSALPASAAAAEPRDPVLARGAALHGANGVMFDRHDRLHIASVVGREIAVMDPRTGAILDRIGPDRGVEGPDDLTFGPDGALYWTSYFTGVVARRTADGTVSTVAQLAPGVGAITFSDDGRLFVAASFPVPGGVDALYELDPNGANPPRLIADRLGGLNAMDWGSDGFLYGPLSARGQVVRVNVDSGAIALVAHGFGLPTAVKFDSRGRLHVADQRSVDQQRGEVVRVDLATGDTTVIAALEPGLDSLAFDSHDRLFVSSAQDGFIAEVEHDGEVRTVSRGGMILPGGVAALPRGDEHASVFVADLFSLRELDAQTGRQRGIERGFVGSSELLSPVFTVAPDGGNLLLSSAFVGAVQVWDPVAHAAVATYYGFAEPLNAIRFQGDLIVAEQGGSVVRASGTNPAERATLAAGLGVPAGLAATEDDLWVGEWATGRVLQLVADGQLLARPRVVARHLAAPEGLAVAAGGSRLLVVESGAGRLLRIELATGRVTTVAEGLALGAQGIPGLAPTTWGFNGVAVGHSGAIYVSGDKANVLYRLD